VVRSDIQMVNKSSLSEEHPAHQFMEEEMELDQEMQEQEHKNKRKHHDQEIKKTKEISWIFPNIVVRVVSKSFENGKYYLKKGVILDVTSQFECTLQLSGTKQLLEVKQRMLETVIPKTGAKVLIVQGKNSRKVGKFMEKVKQGEETLATVQLNSDFSIHHYKLEDISEFVGDIEPS